MTAEQNKAERDVRNVNIVMRCREGASALEIGKEFNLTRCRIYQIIKKHKRNVRTLSQGPRWVFRHEERCAELRQLWSDVAGVDPFSFEIA